MDVYKGAQKRSKGICVDVNDRTPPVSLPPPKPIALDVILCTYNSEKTIRRAVDAVRTSTHVDLRIIVVDNASSDATLAQLPDERGLEIIKNDTNRGFAVAINQGLIRRRREAHILILNPDVILTDTSMLHRLAQHLVYPVGAVTPLLVQPNGVIDHACARPEPTPVQTLQYALGMTAVLQRYLGSKHWYGALPDRPTEVASASGGFMLVSCTAMDSVGLLDESFWMYGEDLDWFRRLRLHGYNILFLPTERAIHWKSGSTDGAWTPETRDAFFDSMILYYRKWRASSRFSRVTTPVVLFAIRSWKRAVSRHPGPKRTQVLGVRR